MQTPPSQLLAITAGEPAGIGPDLCVQLASQALQTPIVVIADKNLLMQRAQQLGVILQLRNYVAGQVAREPNNLTVIHIPLAQPSQAGVLNAANSRYVLATLSRAVQGCQAGEFAGMVTAPVHKGIINDAGIPFTGHTEFLAEQTQTKQVVMMLVGGGMRVALVTIHLPLKDVAATITQPLLESLLRIVHSDLQQRFGIAQPRILVAGLNPHAGEGGYLGREEIDVMIPVLDKLRGEGMNVSVPLPADTLFTPHKLAQCDAVLSMYHDQGLPVLKHASFGQGVNVTLGLPIIRTSVDHGTALDLAGTGKADSGSLLEAIKVATEMVQNERVARA
ncbi:MAG: 4-hydroxythreonine-4-phosphate dehydrogenase PdxA [Gallionella sp.]